MTISLPFLNVLCCPHCSDDIWLVMLVRFYMYIFWCHWEAKTLRNPPNPIVLTIFSSHFQKFSWALGMEVLCRYIHCDIVPQFTVNILYDVMLIHHSPYTFTMFPTWVKEYDLKTCNKHFFFQVNSLALPIYHISVAQKLLLSIIDKNMGFLPFYLCI